MYTGILFMFIPSSAILYYMGQSLNWLINFTNEMLYNIENLPFSNWGDLWINPFECALIAFILFFISLVIFHGYKKLVLYTAALFVMLFSSFSLRRIMHYNLHEIVIYNVRQHTGLAYIFKSQSVIISDLPGSDKLMDFSILPTVKSKGSQHEVFHLAGEVFKGRFYLGSPNFYQFADYRIVKWDKTFDNIRFSRNLKVDAVLISGNPGTTLEDIKASLSFNRIIIEANNPDYKIQRWVSEANEMGIPYYVLKNNPALVVRL
jgi:competence protein ComEC